MDEITDATNLNFLVPEDPEEITDEAALQMTRPTKEELHQLILVTRREADRMARLYRRATEALSTLEYAHQIGCTVPSKDDTAAVRYARRLLNEQAKETA